MRVCQPKWPFGKHKGKRIKEVPRGYLQWALTNCDLRGWLLAAVQATLAGRPLPMTDEEMEQRANEIVGQAKP